MKKNRFLALALSALMSAFAFTACTTAADDTANAGTDAAGSDGADTAAVQTLTYDDVKIGVIHIGNPADGSGYTYAHDQGIVGMQQELGLRDDQIVRKNNVSDSDPAATEAAIRECIEEGCNIIFGTSWGYMDKMESLAAEFPDVYFCHGTGYKNNGTNLNNYFGRIYQARYLSGIVAGMKTQMNYIGYVAAKGIPEVIRGINAFTLGVQSVNPDAKVEVVFTDTWYDPTVEKQAALELLNKGVDIIAQHQDRTAPQCAAEVMGAYCIVYYFPTSDAAPKAYLTAACFDWKTFYTDDVQKAIDGTWTSRAYWEGLAANMTYLDKLTDLCAEGTHEKVDAAKKAIIDGTLEPFTGPLYDQDGNKKVEDGVKMTDDEIWNMNWFVNGVTGTIPA